MRIVFFKKKYIYFFQIEFQTFNYNDALRSYKIALAFQPNDPCLEEAIHKTKVALKKEKGSEEQIPWIGAALGIIAGATIIISSQIFTNIPVSRVSIKNI